jgi:HD-like signal output (HDOD) protein
MELQEKIFYYGNKYELKEKVLEAIERIGILRHACKESGISRATLTRWQYDEKFEEAVLEAMRRSYKKNKEKLDSVPPQKRSWLLRKVMFPDK